MKKFLGYTLAIIGFIGFVFFINYNGTAIPLTAFWLVLSICIAIGGKYFIAKQKLQTSKTKNINSNDIARINQLKLNGEKIRVTLDNAEVKTRSYQSEINDEVPTRRQMLDGLYDGNRNYHTQEIQQTYIVFYKQYQDRSYKFISQSTAQPIELIRRFSDQENGIDLYIDKDNPNNYYFDTSFI